MLEELLASWVHRDSLLHLLEVSELFIDRLVCLLDISLELGDFLEEFVKLFSFIGKYFIFGLYPLVDFHQLILDVDVRQLLNCITQDILLLFLAFLNLIKSLLDGH